MTGEMTISFSSKGNAKTFKRHLKKVLYTYKNHSKIIIVVDNVRYHHSKYIKNWLSKNPQIELMYLSPYSPNLNPIERAWWYMRKKITHNRFVKTLDERKKAFWQMFSHYQKPNDILKHICVINY